MTIDFCCVDSCVQYTVRGPVKPLKPKKLMYADCCAKDETTAMKTMHSIPCFSDTTRLITAVWILKISLKTQKNPKSELAFKALQGRCPSGGKPAGFAFRAEPRRNPGGNTRVTTLYGPSF